MSDETLCFMEVHELAKGIREREFSPIEVVEAHLRRIEPVNPKVVGFLEVTADSAREEARRAESEVTRGGYRGPLHGIPYGVKDIIDTEGVRTTRGSSFFRDRVPSADAECVARLKRAGAILLGKCHTQEFASGPYSYNPHYGTARNPWDLSRMTGGSSAGSAAAVAASLCPAALGTDTGSSIRGPAALCGIVGLKPTHGRVSLSGVCPNAPSFDHVGPMTRSSRDAALMLQGMAGFDEGDPHSRDDSVPDFSAKLRDGVRGMRMGLCPDLYDNAEVDRDVMRAFERAVEVFRGLGAEVVTLTFAHAARFQRVILAIIGAEFVEFHRPLFEKDPAGYGEEVRKRVEGWMRDADFDEYVRAQRERELLRREVLKLLQKADVILTPALPCVAPPVDTLKALINGEEVDYSLAITMPFLTPQNLTGCPAVVIPMAFSKEGLPVSLQIIGRPWEEAEVLRAAHAYEEATPEMRRRRPPID